MELCTTIDSRVTVTSDEYGAYICLLKVQLKMLEFVYLSICLSVFLSIRLSLPICPWHRLVWSAQGGNNAGHTVQLGSTKFFFHLLPR